MQRRLLLLATLLLACPRPHAPHGEARANPRSPDAQAGADAAADADPRCAAPSPATSAVAATPARRPQRLADTPHAIDALFATATNLYGVSTTHGEIFSIALDAQGAPNMLTLHTGERAPITVRVVGDTLVWAGADGVFASKLSGQGRRALKTGASVRALTSDGNRVYFATENDLWQLDMRDMRDMRGAHAPSPTAQRVARGVVVDELVAVGTTLVWRDGRELWRLDLASGGRTQLPASRKPHGLATDGRQLFWHEGEADLLPGREPRALAADGQTWSIRELPGAYDSADQYLIDGTQVFGPGRCKHIDLRAWMAIASDDPHTSLGVSPIAANAATWFWAEMLCQDGGCGPSMRVFAADRAHCR